MYSQKGLKAKHLVATPVLWFLTKYRPLLGRRTVGLSDVSVAQASCRCFCNLAGRCWTRGIWLAFFGSMNWTYDFSYLRNRTALVFPVPLSHLVTMGSGNPGGIRWRAVSVWHGWIRQDWRLCWAWHSYGYFPGMKWMNELMHHGACKRVGYEIWFPQSWGWSTNPRRVSQPWSVDRKWFRTYTERC